MEKLKSNQILLEISENKKELTVSCGAFFNPITFSSCPTKVTKNLNNAINAYIEKTGIDNIPKWESEKCGYEGGTGRNCN